MAFVITEDCVSCGACAGSCPVEAIAEGSERYVIDQDKCIQCGNCKDTCPTGAIVEQ